MPCLTLCNDPYPPLYTVFNFLKQTILCSNKLNKDISFLQFRVNFMVWDIAPSRTLSRQTASGGAECVF